MVNFKKHNGTKTRLASGDVNSAFGQQIIDNDDSHKAAVKEYLMTKYEHLGNIIGMAAVLHDMPNDTFDTLYSMVRNLPYDKMTLGSHRYIEAQIHTDILFDRDVEKICINNRELNSGSPEENQRVAETIGHYLNKNPNIRVEYFD